MLRRRTHFGEGIYMKWNLSQVAIVLIIFFVDQSATIVIFKQMYGFRCYRSDF